MRKPTQRVAAITLAERQASRGRRGDRRGQCKSKTTIRPMFAVMPEVVAKHSSETVTTEKEQPVEALRPHGSDDVL